MTSAFIATTYLASVFTVSCCTFIGLRDSLDDNSKAKIKGRFSVTSENVDLVKVNFFLFFWIIN